LNLQNFFVLFCLVLLYHHRIPLSNDVNAFLSFLLSVFLSFCLSVFPRLSVSIPLSNDVNAALLHFDGSLKFKNHLNQRRDEHNGEVGEGGGGWGLGGY
jgi:hypothetical protein